MNDHRFIELLNLYLDHQINPAEAVELEAAVHSSPALRRTYEEYCQLQRGCSQLGSSFRSCAPTAPRFTRSLQAAERKITSPRKPRHWYPLQLGGLATVAMAAGFALVVLTNHIPDSWTNPESKNTVFKATQNVEILEVANSISQPEKVSIAPFIVEPTHVVIGLGAAVALNTDYVDVTPPGLEALEWMQRVDQLPIQPLIVDAQIFSTKAMVPPDTHVLHRPRHSQASAEFTGLRLTR
jgi:anti-sigma factor RsiW